MTDAPEVPQPTGRDTDHDFRLVSPSGADVVRPDRLDAKSRALAMLPSAFTLANMLCGFSSLRAAEGGQYDLAAILIAVAVVCDIFDGAVARAVRAITPFGLQFDSLADLISFGVAPAFLLYEWSLHDLGLLGWVLACFWLACAAFRLGRFNVTIDPLSDKRYFIGLPSPGGAGVVIASVFAYDGDFAGWHRAGPVLLVMVPAVLMASSFRFTSFRWLASPRPDRIWVTVVAVVLLVLGLVFVPVGTALFIAYTYVALAPLGWLTRPLRKRWFGEAAVAPPRRPLPSVFFLVGEDEVPPRS
ncbi:phosphatidylcholine/phosphatidylserine synthase [Aquihabitans sp. G128]|uniref:CDP-alcohol phosphatidyltransferase family protein n=1 Tax=Aquihabitans sp. G128 TaxID=2849779 RepID=UPI001C22643A|nr:phosphatidylcholine/phosphatidylserine synthase [Aquihabitans sp. G128]QXC63067.1 phosphatidylcholine/phosphatidylserine synthase [Aquihabitans sp. G128]